MMVDSRAAGGFLATDLSKKAFQLFFIVLKRPPTWLGVDDPGLRLNNLGKKADSFLKGRAPAAALVDRNRLLQTDVCGPSWFRTAQLISQRLKSRTHWFPAPSGEDRDGNHDGSGSGKKIAIFGQMR